MWKRFKEWMGTDKAGAITNGLAVPFWVYLTIAVKESLALQVVSGINAVIFAFAAGAKTSDMFWKRLKRGSDVIYEHQQRMILELLAERARRRAEERDAFESLVSEG